MYDGNAQSQGYLDVGGDAAAKPATVSAVGNPMYGMQDGSSLYSDGTAMLNNDMSHGAALTNAMYQAAPVQQPNAGVGNPITTPRTYEMAVGKPIQMHDTYLDVKPQQVHDQASGKIYDVAVPTGESSSDGPVNAQTL